MTNKINLVAEITDSDLTLEVIYPKGTDPELANSTNEELTEVFKNSSNYLRVKFQLKSL